MKLTFLKISALVLLFALLTACSAKNKTQPDVWNPVTTGNDFRGTWSGAGIAEVSNFGEYEIPVAIIPFNILIINDKDPETIEFSFRFDINNYLENILTLFPINII